MNYSPKKTDVIITFLTDKKFFIYRNILLALIVMTISAETAFIGIYNGLSGQWLIFITFSLITLSLILFNLHILAPKYLLKNNFSLYVITLFLSILFALFLIIISQFNANLLDSLDRNTYQFSTSIINILSVIIIFMFVSISSSSFLLFQQWVFHEQRIYQLKNINSQFEIEQLKNQINPHFLFNMLNNVNVLIKKNPMEASIVLHKLSDLLKYQIKKSSKDFISLDEDIQFLTDFLNLEKIRRDHFEFTLSVEGNKFIHLPPLLFIPFVENAVKHNSDSEKNSYIHIIFKVLDNSILFSCTNSKPKDKNLSIKGGLGLINIKRRLELLYPEKHILDIEDKIELYMVKLSLNFSK